MARLAADHLTAPAREWPSQDLHLGISGWTCLGWRGHGDVYIYFDNDAKVHAPFSARTLAQKLQLQGAAI